MDRATQIAELTARLTAMEAEMRRMDDRTLDEQLSDLHDAMTSTWLILCAALNFLMQAGFALLEAGCCRQEFVSSVLEKNLLDACIAGIMWYCIGWGIAYGSPSKAGGFIGVEEFFGSAAMGPYVDGLGFEPNMHNLNWFFQFTFAATSTTIISGAMAERLYLSGYILFCIVNVGIAYPMVVAWTWGGGWLYEFNNARYVDFAGSGVVHMIGGLGGLAGTTIIGKRIGRYDPDVDQSEFDPHNVVFVVLGTLILWFGWYGFNCGSTLAMDPDSGKLAAQVAVNTVLCPCMCGLTVGIYERVRTHRWNLPNMCSGCLAGLVSITAPCGNVHSHMALIIGFIGAWVYYGANQMLVYFKIDDPVQAFPVHGACGVWGLLATAIFDWGLPHGYYHGWGGFSPSPGANFGQALAAQVVAIIVLAVWIIVVIGGLFYGLKSGGLLRISKSYEAAGSDLHEFTPKRVYAISKTQRDHISDAVGASPLPFGGDMKPEQITVDC
jgi:Amt family ammonium transporter